MAKHDYLRPSTEISRFKRFLRYPLIFVGASTMTFAGFLVLPLLQTISGLPTVDLIVRDVEPTQLPPPPPPPEEEQEPEPEPEEKPPELNEAPPLDLSQLEMALNPGFGEGWMSGDLGVRLTNITGGGDDGLFSMSDLDQRPRPTYRPSPVITKELRKLGGGKVILIFIVNERGRVEQPKVERSSDPAFERAALDAIKKWRFEPGKRSGKPVSFRMRQPITFPKV